MKAKDFASNQEVRWCPGCGNYVVLSVVQRLLSELGVQKENVVFISGIGCSSRLVYYLDTYGFHTIHGRATAIAAGLKMMRPELSVWVITGDGDGLSIGLGHLLHLMRRDLDINILLLNNQIYGLTKGQYSPTTKVGVISSSSPFGNVDRPINPIKLAIASECGFVARTMDADPIHMLEIIKKAVFHKGTSFIEILQKCLIYNDDSSKYRDKNFRNENCIYLEDNKPIKFGKDLKKGITINNQKPQIIQDIEKTLIYRSGMKSGLATVLADLQVPEFPLVLGTF